MATRKALNDIAAGLYGSFLSRNNDLAGYWAIGKLYALAQDADVANVCIDLCAESIRPESAAFAEVIERYAEFLKRKMAAHGLPPAWLLGAQIELCFAPVSQPSVCYQKLTWHGSLFELRVRLIDDQGRAHERSGHGHCDPHDARREIRSLRYAP